MLAEMGEHSTHGPRLLAAQQPSCHERVSAGTIEDQTLGTRQIGRRDFTDGYFAETNLILRRARLEGRQIGRARLDVDREQVVIDRRSGLSLTQVAKKHCISRASVCRLMKEANVTTTPAVLIPPVEMAQRVGAGQ